MELTLVSSTECESDETGTEVIETNTYIDSVSNSDNSEELKTRTDDANKAEQSKSSISPKTEESKSSTSNKSEESKPSKSPKDTAQNDDSKSAPSSSSSATEIKIDEVLYLSRLERLWKLWDVSYQRTASPWHKVDAFIMLNGEQDADKCIPKTAVIHLWLFGYEFPGTLIVLTREKKVHILSSPKKLRYVKALKKIEHVLYEKKNAEHNAAKLKQIRSAISASTTAVKPRIGRLKNDFVESHGDFAEEVKNAIGTWGFDEVKVDLPISKLLSKHDYPAQLCIQKAGLFATSLTTDVLVARIETILDSELQESHESICERADQALDDEKRLKQWKAKKLNASMLDLVYVLVQSGNKFTLRANGSPSPSPFSLQPGCFIVALAAKYGNYIANITRTFLLDATEGQKTTYQLAYDVMHHLIQNMRPGKQLKSLYESARGIVKKRSPELLDKMTKTLGHVIGLEFGDASLTISPKNENCIENGQAYNLSIGFSDVLSNDKDPTSSFAVWIADTVIVRAEGPPQCVTQGVEKRLQNVYYCFRDESQTNENEDTSSTRSQKVESRDMSDATKKSDVVENRLRERRGHVQSSSAEQLLAKQQALRTDKLAEIKRRYAESENFLSTDKKNVRVMSSLCSYKEPSEYPKDIIPNKIMIDNMRESILVPIGGVHVPFHVSTIRNVVSNGEHKFHTMRINFQVPDNVSEMTRPNRLHIKELIYKSTDENFSSLARQVKEIQKKARNREIHADEKNQMAILQPLKLNREGRRVLLQKLMMKSAGMYNRRALGTLEAHHNGLRFQVNRLEPIDINYSNIKHAIFHPCERELVVLMHLHLKNPIHVGKGKSIDFQFFMETGSQTDDLHQRKARSTYDPDEISEEQKEQEMKRRLNAQFKRFIEGVEDMSKIQFEVPLRELAFKGVPKNSQQDMHPTAHCLVQLVEWPPFIMTLDEVEIVCFERVTYGLRSFDMAFVHKDYSLHVRSISSINIEALDTIKKWLNEINMVWYEVKPNLNWDTIMKTIRQDVEHFLEDGAFESFLGEQTEQKKKSKTKIDDGKEISKTDGNASNPEDENESAEEVVVADNEDEDDEDDEDYRDEDSDDDSNSEGSGSGSAIESMEEEESEDAGFGSASEEEDDGLSWDELEKKAMIDDRKRGYEDEAERNAKRKKPRRES